MAETEDFWNRIARKYAADPIKDMEGYNRTIDRTREHLSRGARVLEVGCGSGATALLLAPEVGHITASDISSEMIAIGREKAAGKSVANIDFVRATPFDDAFPEAPYDAVLAYNFLHLVPDVPALIDRLAELLRPGGLLISNTPNIGGARRLVLQPLIAAMRLFGKAPPGLSFVSPKQLKAMIAKAGFEIVVFEFHGDSRPFIVAKKK
ncbi:MAG: hypothetical protein Rhirs2KO_23730 [Rhizobiaceae bacterium]